jgi:hypothetical protein
MIAEASPRAQTEDLANGLPDDLEPSADSARMLRMSRQSWHKNRALADDPLPAIRLGRRWFASRSEVLRWVARRSGRA